MPKSAKIPENPTEGATVHSTVNGINETLLKGYVNSIEEEEAGMCHAQLADLESQRRRSLANLGLWLCALRHDLPRSDQATRRAGFA
jgi:hypothetical protein